MESLRSAIERFLCYILDGIFRGIMVLLYGASLSETKAQKLSRLGMIMLIIVGIMIVIIVKMSISKPPAIRQPWQPSPIKPAPYRDTR